MEMSIDRLIAVRYPMEARTKCTVNRALKVIAASAVFVAGANLHIFFVFHKGKLGKFEKYLEGGGLTVTVRDTGHSTSPADSSLSKYRIENCTSTTV
jgi:hypothetical protein